MFMKKGDYSYSGQTGFFLHKNRLLNQFKASNPNAEHNVSLY